MRENSKYIIMITNITPDNPSRSLTNSFLINPHIPPPPRLSLLRIRIYKRIHVTHVREFCVRSIHTCTYRNEVTNSRTIICTTLYWDERRRIFTCGTNVASRHVCRVDSLTRRNIRRREKQRGNEEQKLMAKC